MSDVVMIYTARQLEDLHRANGNGRLVLPYGARMTPLGVDWVRSRKIVVGYGPDEMVRLVRGEGVAPAKPHAVHSGTFLWWCYGPCGAGKAAVGAIGKEVSLAGVDLPAEGQQLVAVIKRIALDVKEGKAAGGVLMVQAGGAAVVLANRCSSLRAVLGTTFESLEAGIASVAANVLVVEYPRKSFSEIRNLVSRFVRAGREVSEELKRQIREVAACG